MTAQKKALTLSKREKESLQKQLDKLATVTHSKYRFLIEYQDVYNFPKKLLHQHLKDYRKILSAIEVLSSTNIL
jgi:hypothetical protein